MASACASLASEVASVERLQHLMQQSEQLTAANTGATVVIAVDYGGQWDIAQATQKLAEQVQEGSLAAAGYYAGADRSRTISISDLPRPDLCIRTGGDARISNFMLWHFAYTELYFTDTLWPDFDEAGICPRPGRLQPPRASFRPAETPTVWLPEAAIQCLNNGSLPP